MGYQELVLGREAEAISGVSLTTLNRFVEAGYLQVETDSEGVPWYSKSELLKLFGLGGQEAVKSHFGGTAEREAVAVERSAAATSERKQQSEASTTSEPKNEPHSLSDLIELETTSSSCQIEYVIPTPDEIAQADTIFASSNDKLYEREIARQRNLIELQEKLLDIRDKQIADLKEQRDWLQKRVERFEEKNERDQLLLLSETQTIRKLISLHDERKSGLRLALEWLGLAKPLEQPTSSTGSFIDITSQKSGASNRS